jgi:hypothetical protein
MIPCYGWPQPKQALAEGSAVIRSGFPGFTVNTTPGRDAGLCLLLLPPESILFQPLSRLPRNTVPIAGLPATCLKAELRAMLV